MGGLRLEDRGFPMEWAVRKECTAIAAFLFVVSLAVIVAHLPFPAGASEGRAEDPTRAVWLITNERGNYQGTAFAVGKNLFMTNGHILAALADRDSSRILLRQNGRSGEFTVKATVAISQTYDLALVETAQHTPYHLKIASGFSGKGGGRLRLVGYPDGRLRIFRQSADMMYEDELSYLVAMNGVVSAGSSGSPLLEPGGEVVAVAYSSLEGANMMHAIKLQNLRRFLSGETGVVCVDPPGLRPCIRRARQRMERLAHGGNRLAQFRLSYSYDMSKGGVEWLLRSAAQGHAPAQRMAGVMAFRQKNWSQALHWLKVAAKQNYPLALLELAFLHEDGNGVAKNRSLSFALTRKAARSGGMFAQYNLAHMYQHGLGTERNLDSAIFWYEMAARNGDDEARKVLRNEFGLDP